MGAGALVLMGSRANCSNFAMCAAGVVRCSQGEASAVVGCWHAADGDPARQQVLAHTLGDRPACIACCRRLRPQRHEPQASSKTAVTLQYSHALARPRHPRHVDAVGTHGSCCCRWRRRRVPGPGQLTEQQQNVPVHASVGTGGGGSSSMATCIIHDDGHIHS